MINITNEEFAEIVGEVINELDMKDVGFSIILIGAMIGAKAEERTEKKEAEKKEIKDFEQKLKQTAENLYCYNAEYDAGKWNILIENKENDKARLRIRLNGAVICDRVLDSLYKAYNYAFNIICH